MASRKKRPAKKKSPVKRGRSAAKKARQKKKAPRKNPAAEPKTIFVTYPPDPTSDVGVDPDYLTIRKRETVIYWKKAAGSAAITFTLDPSTDKCPFGKLTLNATSTKITLRYHGTGDRDKDWIYQARVTATGEVEISSGGPMLGGSTIKNH
jgi:hypothetical protein